MGGGGAGGGSGGGSGVGGGTGGGAGGGSAAVDGGTGGGTAACQTLAVLPQSNVLEALYNSGSDGGDELHSGIVTDVNPTTSADGGHSEYYFQIYYFSGATLGAHTLAATTNAACSYCLYLDVGCDAVSACTTNYVAQGGAINIATATKNEAAGKLTASATDLHFVEWNFGTDTAVANGKCIDVGQANIDVAWSGPSFFQGDGGPP